MGDRTAFFYGTLMAPGVFYRVIYGNANPSPTQQAFLPQTRPALLPSYRRHRIKSCQYPAIVPCEGSSVRGTAVTGLTQGDIYRLDIFEGDQYERRTVKVKVLAGVALDEKVEDVEGVVKDGGSGEKVEEEIEADVYVWIDGRDKLEEQEWDFERFKRDKMKVWMGGYPSDSEEEDDDGEKVEVDPAFAEVDAAVAALAAGKDHDPMGGRGVNGRIGKQLESVR